MLNRFNERTQKIIAVSESIAFDFGHSLVGSEHLLLALLKIKDSKLRLVLLSYNLSYEKVKKQVVSLFKEKDFKPYYMEYTLVLKKIMENSYLEAKKQKEEKVNEEILTLELLKCKDSVASDILQKNDLDIKEIMDNLKKSQKRVSELDKIEDLVNINNLMRKRKDEVILRDEDTNNLIEALLRKKKPNALLLGEPGVGKSALIYHLANLINLGKVNERLKDKIIYELDLSSVVAGTKYRGEFEEKLRKILRKAREDDNAIIFIDEFHNLVGAGGAEGAIDASNILKPYLSREEIQIIGATTYDEYYRIIEKDKALERRFQIIKVPQLTKEETLKVLESLSESYIDFFNVDIKEGVLKFITYEASSYLVDRYYPDKAIDILDSSFVHCKSLDKKILDEEIVIKTLESKFKIALKKDNKIPLYNLLKEKIIGEDEALLRLSKDIKCIEEGLIEKCRPIGVFLMIGPSGVGKSESSKLLAKYYFGKDSKVIKIDMSLFKEPSSVAKLIGAPPGYVGYDSQSYLIEEIRKNPHSLILLDEIEKADKEVINIFLGVFDEGYFIDSKKRKIDFTNSIIVMTSNLGYLPEYFNKEKIGFFKKDVLKEEINKEVNNFFKSEFLNRIDDIIYFKPLDRESAFKLGKLYYEDYLKGLNINYEVASEEIEKIIDKVNVNIEGARGIKREVKKAISENILKSKI